MGQGACIFGCSGPRLTRDEATFFAGAQPWGFILFARNVESPDQLRALTADLRTAVGREAPVLIDQEGGRVQRMGPPHWRQWLPPLDHAAQAGAGAERAFELRARLIAAELHEVGIDVDCIPTADLATETTHPFLRNRCYGGDVETVVRLARATVAGLLAGGVLPVLKHMPGHGRATVDSHLHLPRVSADAATLAASDFAVFRALAGLPLGMSAHIVFEALSRSAATVDPAMTALIRRDIGFGGFLMTDDISMEALDGTVVTRSRQALAAGCDAVLHCNGRLDEMRAVAEVAGPLSAAGQGRADAALACRKPPAPIDIGGVEAELEALMAGGTTV